jgi:hypothetical protein
LCSIVLDAFLSFWFTSLLSKLTENRPTTSPI